MNGLITNYITKTIPFKFRGIDFTFALSQGLFSSADVDSGTRLLLKVLSRLLDEDAASSPDGAVNKSLPRYVLDCGCGAGVIGICAAAALLAMGGDPAVRSQDRDELARLVTSHNAAKNGIPAAALEAYTEPLLADSAGARRDLILSNIPAKAGKPVLEDFARRSMELLAPGGRVVIVAVHTLEDFFREQIAAAGGCLLREEKNAGYCVFVYRANSAAANTGAPLIPGPGFLERYPFYIRTRLDYTLEDIPLRLQTVYGAPGFDAPGGAVLAAIKLIRRLGAGKLFPMRDDMAHNGTPLTRTGPPKIEALSILMHEPGQGFFPCWLLEFLRREVQITSAPRLALSGRNVLSLEAVRHNVNACAAAARPDIRLVPAVDPRLDKEVLLEAAAGRRFGFIAAFPELLSQSPLPRTCCTSPKETGADLHSKSAFASLWEALPPLLADGGACIIAFSSADAERFDRKKPAGFTRLGDIKRGGFRALGYTYTSGHDR